MRIRLCFTLAAVTFASVLAIAAAKPGMGQTSRKASGPPAVPLIDCLDAQVQERFGKAVMDFGYSRVADTRHGRHKFLPENPQEIDAVTGLENAGLQVVLYVAGRQVLDPGFTRALAPRRAMQGPVRVTTSDEPIADAPATAPLLDHMVPAFAAFSKGRDYEFEAAGWRMVARPVRAKDASCLQCHYQRPAVEQRAFGASDDPSRVRVGDPLGAIIYGYRQRERP